MAAARGGLSRLADRGLPGHRSLGRTPGRAARDRSRARHRGRAAVTALPPVVTASWVAEHGAEDDVLLADVRGPNAHARGHLPGSIPLVVGAPGQFTDSDVVDAFAREVGLRLRRHGITGEERLVLYDEGRCVAAASAVQTIELAGHPQAAVLAGGLAAWQGEIEEGTVVLDKTRTELEPRLEAFPTLTELRGRLADPTLTIVDVR